MSIEKVSRVEPKRAGESNTLVSGTGASRARTKGLAYALLAAILFGLSTPFTRPIVARFNPAASAGYLYLGQAIILSILLLVSRIASSRREAGLGRADLPALVLGTVTGGLLAPEIGRAHV